MPAVSAGPWTPAVPRTAITAELAAGAAPALPQPLTYLISDTARRHGRVRIAPASCVLHGDEPALLAEIAAHRGLTKLALRQLAPTVLVSRSPTDTTLAALRAEGYAPVAETAEGTVRIDKTPASAGRRSRPGATRHQSEGAASGPPPPSRRRRPPPSTRRLGDPAAQAAPPATPDPAPFDGGAPFGTDTEEIVAG